MHLAGNDIKTWSSTQFGFESERAAGRSSWVERRVVDVGGGAEVRRSLEVEEGSEAGGS